MLQIKSFVCNAFQENTYIVYDDTKECVIIDPGMSTGSEENELLRFIAHHKLKPVLSLNTHCHLDHVFGNKFVFDTYGLLPQFHEGEMFILSAMPAYSQSVGMKYDLSPLPEVYLPESGAVTFGNTAFDLLFVPGHSPAHLCFYSKADKVLLSGDALFYGSIGRTDQPGGNHQQLLTNIKEKLFTLPEDVTVYPGHGQSTTIGFEKYNNPFF
ncbi:MBL fold metallo-hydrolase [Pedobacter sp. HMF7647]|uniref:MBL fold metallo-hydrolase n=1 Tax=Hufsiella arboris TaxID=2695275 RepID=A0A7K1Y690_9SPHI|nr:MBL fold metallo-hydrolase [Hufsiella arboris]MXV49548.1 MBL fold metallo-hydrolase [Hufsiella arboris]